MLSLIQEGTSPVQLKSLLGSLEMNLAIPDVPAGWFASPREIARALLDRHNAHLQSNQLRQSLRSMSMMLRRFSVTLSYHSRI